MSYFPVPYTRSNGKVKVEFDLSNYPTKSDLQSATDNLVKKADCDTKIEDIEEKVSNYGKYIISIEFNKLTKENFSERLKQAQLATNNDLNNVEQCAIKNEEKIEKYKHLI